MPRAPPCGVPPYLREEPPKLHQNAGGFSPYGFIHVTKVSGGGDAGRPSARAMKFHDDDVVVEMASERGQNGSRHQENESPKVRMEVRK